MGRTTAKSLQLPARLARITLPAALRRQPLMQHDPLYALPSTLLVNLTDPDGNALIDSGPLDVEQQLAQHCEEHGIVGYSRRKPVLYELLADPDRRFDVYRTLIHKHAELSGRQPPTPKEEARGRRRAVGAISVVRGYAGWLVTNPTYRSELRAVEDRWKPMIKKYGLPAAGLQWMAASAKPRKRRSEKKRYLCDLADFCVRWRLQGLASLELPLPLGPHLPIVDPALVLKQMRAGGFGMFLPDTFPVPSREELREIGLKIQVQRLPSHLAGWGGIVRREHGNTAGIERYGHILAIQHYWSILESRHDGLFKGNLKHMDEALGAFLSMTSENVRKLRRQI